MGDARFGSRYVGSDSVAITNSPRRLGARARPREAETTVSFVIDPPLLVASGAAVERAVEDPRLARVAEVATVTAFIGVSLALYANAPGLRAIWGSFGARSGREFMLTSGLARIDERSMGRGRHLAALSQFALYPAWFRIGAAIAQRGERDVGAG